MKLFLIGMIFLTLLLFELIFFENIFSRAFYLYNTKSIMVASFYLFINLFGFLALTLLIFFRKRAYYIFSLLLISLTYGVEAIYKGINNTGFTLNDLNVALAEMNAFALDALMMYSDSIVKAFISLLFLLLILFSFRRIIDIQQLYISTTKIVTIFIFSMLFSFYIIYKTGGVSQSRPTVHKVLNMLSYAYLNSIYYGDRENLTAKPNNKSKYNNIILIVDESVGGAYLSINGYPKDTTPYLESISENYLNLGLASSAFNCSRSSNLMLMSGLRFNQLPDKKNISLKKSTIFQYAKNAGYTTHYISGQSKPELQNYITKYDVEDVDNFFQYHGEFKHGDVPEHIVMEQVEKALKISDKNFIFIVKRGSHFHWENSYPKEERIFKPTLDVEDSLVLEKREKAINSYLNSIRYNVDLFFKVFLKKINFFERKDMLILYTSDHGQSILEEGRTSTHCDSRNPPLSQGVVPILLFSNKSDDLIKHSTLKRDIYSHYQIFPTLQKFMGYSKIEGKTFFEIDRKSSQQIFYSGDIFGRVPPQQNDIHLRFAK